MAESQIASIIRILFHLVAFGVNFGGLWYDVLYISERGEGVLEYRGFPGKFKHLTFWDQILQTVYFGYSVINDLFGSNVRPWEDQGKRSTLQRIRDGFAASIAFPMGCFVVVVFWGLYAVDRELVFPKHLDKIVPQWLNHVMHTTVILFLFIDKYLVYHNYPRRVKGITGTVAFAALYQAWILWIAYYAQIWVYPVLQVLNLAGKAVFLSSCWVIVIILYLIGEWITNNVWCPATVTIPKKAN